ncbi:MAG TPA: putative phage abortive infection protein [Geobacteraceae bacterium]
MKELEKYSQPILGGIALYIVAFFLYWVAMKSNFLDTTNQNGRFALCGQVGDTFGAFNAFVSGLALLGLVVTLALQIHQFKKTQETTDENQAENSFFTMVDVLNGIVDSMTFTILDTINEKEIKFKGKECFSEIFRELENIAAVRKKVVNLDIPMLAEEEERVKYIVKQYEDIYTFNHEQLGHFFRYLYNIIKYIKFKFKEKDEMQSLYIGLLQAQLSNHELALLMCNALSKHGKSSTKVDQFRQWLDEHNFLENIDRSSVIDPALLKCYPKTTFKFLKQSE